MPLQLSNARTWLDHTIPVTKFGSPLAVAYTHASLLLTAIMAAASVPATGLQFVAVSGSGSRKGSDGVDAPRRHRCARMETLITI